MSKGFLIFRAWLGSVCGTSFTPILRQTRDDTLGDAPIRGFTGACGAFRLAAYGFSDGTRKAVYDAFKRFSAGEKRERTERTPRR